MKLLEYEAKGLLQRAAVAVPKNYIADSKPEFLPAVLKSQVPTGGRGKAGGVVIVKDTAAYVRARKKIKSLKINTFIPKTVLAEELLTIDRELYLSLFIDKKAAAITLMAHLNGGVEVEENPASTYLTLTISESPDFDQLGQSLADYYNLADKTFALQDLVEKLYGAFVSQDMTLCEINPLVLTRAGELVAGDAKVTLDDAAAFRHPDWAFEDKKPDANFVTLDKKGNVATIANGAGLAMATVDAVADAGMQPANFLDIGGGASEASVLAAFKRIVEYQNVRVIIINIFAGITRCDEVARAIIAARSQLDELPPLAIRLAGTNYEQAAELLADAGVQIHANLEEAITSAKESL
jgi:succinyl-CoA synthetase beta subunit